MSKTHASRDTSTGKIFEEENDLRKIIDPHYSRRWLPRWETTETQEKNSSCYYDSNNKLDTIYVSQRAIFGYLDSIHHNYKKNLLKKYGEGVRTLKDNDVSLYVPDAVILRPNIGLAVVMEIKNQNVNGSVDEKLATSHMKTKYWNTIFNGSAYKNVKYGFLLSSYFKTYSKNAYIEDDMKDHDCCYFYDMSEIPPDYLGF